MGVENLVERPARTHSVLVEALVNATDLDLEAVNIEIEETEAYLDKLKQVRETIAMSIGEDNALKRKSENASQRTRTFKKIGEWCEIVAKHLRTSGPLRASRIREQTGINNMALEKVLKDDWFEREDKLWKLSTKGLEYGPK